MVNKIISKMEWLVGTDYTTIGIVTILGFKVQTNPSIISKS